jgi:uncharacterized protein involved in type VI secretion and phage assembly
VTGDPAIAAGAKLHLEGIGSRLTGSYRVTAVEHTYGSTRSYVTRFVCGGKEPGGLADLTDRAAAKLGWTGLVVGVVTNNDDPEKLGRVRVHFPTLSAEDESAWARLATPGGGKQRGMQWLPEVDDEVLLGFELDDNTRPVILGGLWNRTDGPPQPDAAAGGSVTKRLLASRKDSRLVFEDDQPYLELSLGGSPCRLKLEAGESSLTGDRKLVLSATQIEIKASSKLTLSGATVEISGKPIRLN